MLLFQTAFNFRPWFVKRHIGPDMGFACGIRGRKRFLDFSSGRLKNISMFSDGLMTDLGKLRNIESNQKKAKEFKKQEIPVCYSVSLIDTIILIAKT